MAGAGGGPAGTAGMGQYQQVSQPRFVPRATRIISTNVCASLFTTRGEVLVNTQNFLEHLIFL